VERLEEEGYPYDAVAILVAADNRGLEPGLVSYLNLTENPASSELQIEFQLPVSSLNTWRKSTKTLSQSTKAIGLDSGKL